MQGLAIHRKKSEHEAKSKPSQLKFIQMQGYARVRSQHTAQGYNNVKLARCEAMPVSEA